MKYFLLFLMAPLALLAQNEPMQCAHKERLIEIESQRAASLRGFQANPLTASYDVKYHRFDWYIDPAQHYIQGSVTTHFIPVDTGMAIMNFDLDDNNRYVSPEDSRFNINLCGRKSLDVLASKAEVS